MSNLFSTQGFYDFLAPLYGPVMRLLPVWRRYIEAVLPWLPAEGPLLEIGPGPGYLLQQLADRNDLLVGLDRSPGMLRVASRRLRMAGPAPSLVRGDAVRLPFRTESLAGVTLTFALSAIPAGDQAVGEMARVLRPGGVLVLVDAGYPSDGNPIGSALAWFWERFGDFMRDEAALMSAARLVIESRREFGVGNGIRLVVGRKPPA